MAVFAYEKETDCAMHNISLCFIHYVGDTGHHNILKRWAQWLLKKSENNLPVKQIDKNEQSSSSSIFTIWAFNWFV